jgi:zinc protease
MSLRSRAGLAVALALFTMTLPPVRLAVAASAPVGVPRVAYERFVLPNGLTLLVHEDHKAPIVAVNVWYHVGSKNEKAGKTGFAHLFEHLMFNGSENFPDDYFKAVEPIGATDLNGTTNEDRTNYFQNVPTPALDRVLWLESDRMGHLLGAIDQKVLDEQRGVVQNEKRQGENEPYGKLWITIAENAFPKGHPYSWSVIGSMEDLNAASLDDVKEWFRTYYGCANAVLVVAGDITPQVAREKVEAFFGDIPPGPPVIKHAAWIAKSTGTHRMAMQDRVPQARVVKVWNVPALGAEDYAALELVKDLLAGGKNSRLFRRLVYTDKIATSVVGYYDAREIAGQILVWADAQPGGDLAAVERAMDEEIAKLLRDGPSGAELARVQTTRRADYVRQIERIGGFGGKSDVLAQGAVYMGDPDGIPKQVDQMLALKPADVRSAANRWLADGQFVVEVHPFPDLEAAAAGADRAKMPEPGAAPEARFPSPERVTLANGLEVALVQRTAVPVVNLALVVDAGYAADAATAPGVANMTMTMLDEGTASRSSMQVSEELAGLGAELRANSGLDVCTVSLSALKDRLAPSLDIMADVVLHPSFPDKEFDRLRQTILAGIQQEKVQPIALALRVLPGLLYGSGHAYGQPLTGSGTEASVGAMKRDDLVRFHQTWFKPNAATLVVVGDITMAELQPQLERVFARWERGDVPRKNIATVPGDKSAGLYVLDRPDAEQSLILTAELITPKANPDEMPFTVFNDGFGGAFTARINMNLREDKHWSYGAGSFAFDARGQRPWFVYAPVQTDKTKESVREILRELREATGSRPLTAAEVADARDRQTLTLAGRWETADAVSYSLQEQLTYGLPADYWQTYAARARAVTPAQAAAVAKKSLDPAKLVWVIVGDRRKIETGLRELGLGELRYLDVDGQPQGAAH